jgi:uncharacterized integral membrane protein (TIGR00698 family)
MKGREHIPGLAIVFAIAFFSYYLSTIHASFDPLVISIIIGMFAGNLAGKRGRYQKGVETAVSVFLPLGIAFYGSQLSVKGLNPGTFPSVFLVFACLFGLTLWVSRIFKIEKNTAILLASGLSVCGAAAIAVISPLVGAKREDTSIAVIAVLMLGLTGMIFYPMLSDMLSLSCREFSFLAGTTLPMLGQVKVAASSVSPECEQLAVGMKLVRISFLFFPVSAAVLLSGKKGKMRAPWFAVLFIAFALAENLTDLLQPVFLYLRSASDFLLSVGLAAIGLSVDFESIMERGITPLAVIFSSWTMTIIVIYIVRSIV